LSASPSPRIDAVVFDIGGVLLDWNPRYLYRKLFDDDASMERFLAEVCTPEWHAAHDRGTPTAESCAALAAQHPEQAELIRAWGERTEEMVAGSIDQTVEILDELRGARVPVYGLTNMEPETYPLRLARYPFMTWFAGTIVSGYERVAKPDHEIFRILLSRFGLRPEHTLFIDDSLANVQAAARLGIQTIRFRSPAQLRGELERLGLLPSRA
jgi:2-haloacid dehalogenase